MKALILSAGFGTRLFPYTQFLPKPLFPIAGVPILHRIIKKLESQGFTHIMVNTHHLNEKIDAFLNAESYDCTVQTRHEKEILDTGGGIKNFADVFGHEPFLVINSDIFTDINFKEVYDYHVAHPYPVTMVMHDYPEFNNVLVDKKGQIQAFRVKESPEPSSRVMAFAGIHVVDPVVLDFIPEKTKYGIIRAYQEMMTQGHTIMSFFARNHTWADIGTISKYREINTSQIIKAAFNARFRLAETADITTTPLKGDGSDRKWYRLSSGEKNLIMVDHGIREQEDISEADAFISIGNHLHGKGLPVPEIVIHDAFSGMVILEDLGDVHLEKYIKNSHKKEDIISAYQQIIDNIIDLSITGWQDFSPSFTYQTPAYSPDMILKYELKYFIDAFLDNFLGENIPFAQLKNDFIDLSEKATTDAFWGLMHRDMQSRNIMVKDDNFYFIDFQGARKGPIQYDIASLLVDPYVALPIDIQDALFEYAVSAILRKADIDEKAFRNNYSYVRLTRNFQMLGAFGYLSTVKQKVYFKDYIPQAFRTLGQNIFKTRDDEFPDLKKMVEQISKKIY